jgi:hypothetical protein
MRPCFYSRILEVTNFLLLSISFIARLNRMIMRPGFYFRKCRKFRLIKSVDCLDIEYMIDIENHKDMNVVFDFVMQAASIKL